MKKVFTHIGTSIMTAISWLPTWIVYLKSDFLYYLIYYIIGYRKDVVYDNLSHAFPEKSKAEISSIAKKYFRHLCDLTVEGIMLKSISSNKLQERMHVTNPELVNSYFEKGESIIVLTMHYNNWEWNSILPTDFNHKILLVYNPARNLTFDSYMNKNRSRFGGELVSTKKILRTILNYQKQNTPTFTWLCADQRPKSNTRFWTTFLNRDAGFFPGPESLAKHTNQTILYQHTRKVKRGYYETTFSLLAENPKNLPQDEVLKRYIAKIEEDIREQPEFYLWSHKRWKHKKPVSA